MTKTEFMLIGSKQRLCSLIVPPGPSINGAPIEEVTTAYLEPYILLTTPYTCCTTDFNYCNIVWGNCGVTLQDKLQKLQNRAARILTYSNYDAGVNNLFELLGWKIVAYQRQIERATMVFKSLQGLAPEYFRLKFVLRKSGYCLRTLL